MSILLLVTRLLAEAFLEVEDAPRVFSERGRCAMKSQFIVHCGGTVLPELVHLDWLLRLLLADKGIDAFGHLRPFSALSEELNQHLVKTVA